MRWLAIVVGLGAAVSCGPRPRSVVDPQPAPVTVPTEPREPRRERIEVKPITIHVRPPHGGPTLVYMPGTPLYEGPPPTAKLAADRAVAARATAFAKARVAALADLRRQGEKFRRDRAAVDRTAPGAEAKLQKLSDEHNQKIAQLEAKRVQASTKLRELLEQHVAGLTLDGAVLRAELFSDLADDELEAKLLEMEKAGMPSGDMPQVDMKKARDAIDHAFAKFPEAEKHLDARYSRAGIYYADDARTGGLLLVQFARDFPSSKYVEAAYHQAGHSLFGDRDPLVRTQALEAFRWLADRATNEYSRVMSRFRLGQIHDRQREWPQAISEMCGVLDAQNVDTAILEDAVSYLTRAIVRGGTVPLASACASQACPCRESVLVDASAILRDREADDSLREVAELGRKHFPQSTNAATWSCDLVEMAFRSGDERVLQRERERHGRERPNATCDLPQTADNVSDAELVRRHVSDRHTIRKCVEEGIEDGRVRGNMPIGLDISIDERGKAEKILVSSPDPDTSDCIRSWITRHRWYDLANTQLVIPIEIEL